jgi:hypothetical protein
MYVCMYACMHCMPVMHVCMQCTPVMYVCVCVMHACNVLRVCVHVYVHVLYVCIYVMVLSAISRGQMGPQPNGRFL